MNVGDVGRIAIPWHTAIYYIVYFVYGAMYLIKFYEVFSELGSYL